MKVKILITVILVSVLLSGCHEAIPKDWKAPDCPDGGLVTISVKSNFSVKENHIVQELASKNWSNIKIERDYGFFSGGTWVNADCPEAYEMEEKKK